VLGELVEVVERIGVVAIDNFTGATFIGIVKVRGTG
jgi:hypothetical protein